MMFVYFLSCLSGSDQFFDMINGMKAMGCESKYAGMIISCFVMSLLCQAVCGVLSTLQTGVGHRGRMLIFVAIVSGISVEGVLEMATLDNNSATGWLVFIYRVLVSKVLLHN